VFKGSDILGVARPHIGEEYVLGAVAPLANTNWSGPWDCAEFVSWCAYQAYRIIYAVRPPDPRRGESYSGWWYEDARSVGRAVSVARAIATPGAVLVRKPRSSGSPRIGHVAISKGDGGTIEAKDRATGVDEVPNAAARLWDIGVLLPGVEYDAREEAAYPGPSHAVMSSSSAVPRSQLCKGPSPRPALTLADWMVTSGLSCTQP
jgi:N-acetylmuramoyl-L-alanine amidase